MTILELHELHSELFVMLAAKQAESSSNENAAAVAARTASICDIVDSVARDAPTENDTKDDIKPNIQEIVTPKQHQLKRVARAHIEFPKATGVVYSQCNRGKRTQFYNIVHKCVAIQSQHCTFVIWHQPTIKR
jgi:hypothetical protein